jgi:hypothetical protein
MTQDLREQAMFQVQMLGEEIQPNWIGLTDEEIDIAWRSVDYTVPYAQFRIDVARAIEAKLKQKNFS